MDPSTTKQAESATLNTTTPAIVVRKQTKLSFSRCLELVLNGIRFRLFRAAITVGIIMLAVAFLTTMFAEAMIGRRVRERLDEQTAPRRTYVFWIDHLTVPLSENRLIVEGSAAAPDDARWHALTTWGGADDAAARDLSQLFTQAVTYRNFFDALSEERRRPLFGNKTGVDMFNFFQSEASMTRLREELVAWGVRFPTSIDAFEEFLVTWRKTTALRNQIIAGHRRAVERAATVLQGRTATDVLADMNEATRLQLCSFGFALDPGEAEVAQTQADLERDAQQIAETLTAPRIRQKLASRLNVADIATVGPLDLYRTVSGLEGARWFANLLAETEGTPPLTETRVYEVAQERLRQHRLQSVATVVAPIAAEDDIFGFSPRVLCLVGVSLLVCMVGIANAMLMSVMERFREIATMKCLGATDRFLMTNFILESCCQGFAGSVAGALLGLGLGTAKAASLYGTRAFVGIPIGGLLIGGAAAVVLGIILSSLAAVYPATVASRLAPMEAMRIE